MAKSEGYLRSQRYAALRTEIDDIVASVGGGYSISAGIAPPPGRAPRGMGGEYADRRWIANKLEVENGRLGNIRASMTTYRGTKSGLRTQTYRKARVDALSTAVSQARAIADTSAEWSFKRAMINDVFTYASAISTVVR